MHNPAQPVDALALAMKEPEGVDLRRPVYLPLDRRYNPRTLRAQRDFAVAAQYSGAQCDESCKMQGQEL
jgi:hypothetical protein